MIETHQRENSFESENQADAELCKNTCSDDLVDTYPKKRVSKVLNICCVAETFSEFEEQKTRYYF